MKETHHFYILACCCIMPVIIISYIFMANYWHLYNVAVAYNEASVDGTTYDQCGIALTVQTDINDEILPDYESGWTQVFHFQAMLYTMIVVMSCVSLIPISYVLYSTWICVNCTMCLAIPAMIVTGMKRLGENGELCALSTAISEPDTGATFADNATMMENLFKAQCVMYILTCCCFNIG